MEPERAPTIAGREQNMSDFGKLLVSALRKLGAQQMAHPSMADQDYQADAATFRLEGTGPWNAGKLANTNWHDKGATSTARELGGTLEGSEQQEVLNSLDNSIGADVSMLSHFGAGEKEKLLAPGQNLQVLARIERHDDEGDVTSWLE